ncbi:MAG: adenylate/guanylate cyclase domain-containing protein [Betaproteobacteria bacterium]|nr:adenylate/guanylate cyclase domain-containing protein [Betaproteobacteria bacterium]
MADWSIAPVIDWLMHKGRHLPTREAVVGGICERVRAAGMPIDRVAFFLWTLHPQYAGVALFWDGEKVALNHGVHGFQATDVYRNSPAARIAEGERVIRRRLEDAACALDFPVLQELREQGMTDYVMAEVVFSDGVRNSVSLTTRQPGGFSEHDIAETQRLLHPFALIMENFNNRDLARTLLETYLGRISGAKVLDGQIKRGDGQSIDAVIWFSDLRESTPLSAALGEQRFLELLNDYFVATAGAVLEHGGEVLRFIGDASLAVFPTAGEATRAVCARAVEAARAARSRVQATNDARRAAGLPAFACGVGLHLGRVHYGNIGTPERLEFSVIGVAANKAARIEALCKETGQDVVLSSTMASELGAPCRSLGKFALRGVGEAEEVFALP